MVGLPSNGYVEERLKWLMSKVGSCGWKLWTEAEQVLGWKDKRSRVSQQQAEKEENRTKQNLCPGVLEKWPVARHERVRRKE